MKRIAVLLLMSSLMAGFAAGAASAASSPAVTTGSASNINQMNALLHGSVNPNGAATTYFFQWGLTTNYGFNGKTKSAGSGTRFVSVSEFAADLLPGTVYHYRLVAQSSLGLSVGHDRTFKTAGHPLPGAVTGGASSITTSSAVVGGEIVTNGQNTGYYFQYGPAAGNYPSQTTHASVNGSSTPSAVSAPIAFLSPGTTVHYRLVVQRSGFGQIFGADASFTTLPTARPFPFVHGSTTPHSTSHRPFTFTTTGTVSSSAFPAAAECSGQVEIRYFFGTRLVQDRFVSVLPNCAFGSVFSFTHRFTINGHRPQVENLHVTVRFLGNGYLAPAKGKAGRPVIG